MQNLSSKPTTYVVALLKRGLNDTQDSARIVHIIEAKLASHRRVGALQNSTRLWPTPPFVYLLIMIFVAFVPTLESPDRLYKPTRLELKINLEPFFPLRNRTEVIWH